MPSSQDDIAEHSVTHVNDAAEYWVDAVQRSILFSDVLRERGNAYLEYEKSGKPPVLVFDYEIIVDGRKLIHPVNYALVLIKPPAGCIPTDTAKRPFVVIDPRAGHGPGIGGSKIDSEIGIALRQGHPCYFVMFFPHPEPNQTIVCVTHAKSVFLKKVMALHPKASSKPFVIGNCQGGWALMMLAALEPDYVGPILLAGSPISYWSGSQGKNPLRYLGGLLGGTWSASFAGDLGNGKFDGANLVNNFEQLDPANTYWTKLYKLYAEIDTERERFLDFERWWGGHFMLNKNEMEWISQNLFVGNRLTSGEIYNEKNVQVNLRNIRSPIIVFASWGDNITSPQQALNWIPDLYDNVDQIRENEQTIVYVLHEQVGHLGIFVSSGIATREHSELASALDLIDILPPGLYEAIIIDSHPDIPGLEYVEGRYVIRFEPREVSDILTLDDGREDEHAFEVVRRVAQTNQTLYDSFLSPFVRALSNEMTASILRNLNVARMERQFISDENPFFKLLQPIASSIRQNRTHISKTNLYLQTEQRNSQSIEDALNIFRDSRDAIAESVFNMIYKSPLTSAMVGFKPEYFQRNKPKVRTWEQNEMLKLKAAEHASWFERGNPEIGFLRLLIYVASGSGVVDKRPFTGVKRVMRQFGLDKTVSLDQLKEAIKRQTFLVRLDEARALRGILHLIPKKAQRRRALELARELLVMGGPISQEKEVRLTIAAQVMGIGARSNSGEILTIDPTRDG
jgi:pimeloyl-ACP methyl ester carboxylesterase